MTHNICVGVPIEVWGNKVECQFFTAFQYKMVKNVIISYFFFISTFLMTEFLLILIDFRIMSEGFYLGPLIDYRAKSQKKKRNNQSCI